MVKIPEKQNVQAFTPDEIIITDFTVSFGLTWKDVIFLPFYRFSVYAFTFVVYATIAIAIFVITFQPTGWHYDDVLFHVATGLDLIYFARTILVILHRLLKEHRRRKIIQPEPALLLVVDVLTLVPISHYCFLVNRFNWYDPIDNRIGYYYSHVPKLPRIIRLFYLYNKSYNDLARHPRTIVLFAHAMISFLCILIFSALYYTVYYYTTDSEIWADRFAEMRRENVTFNSPIITFLYAGGFFFKDILTPMPQYSMYEMSLAVATLMTGYIFHSMYLMPNLIAIYVQLMRFQHFFEWRLEKAGVYMKNLRFDPSLQDAINIYYRTIWVTRGGFVEQPDIVNLFPMELKTEIARDLYFDAMRHSRIFCILSESFKKKLSLLFKTEIYIPGQLMFKKDKVKSKLIYLHSGIVEVMSTENRDSAVLSFSPGTILGEISCLLPYVCTTDVRCSTTCVAHVIRHRALKVLLSKDSALSDLMKHIISERIEYARKKLPRRRKLDQPMSHIFWIKYRWRKLAEAVANKTIVSNEPLTKYYCSRYLNLLVISSRYELMVHSICIRGKCSFVMEQESSFRKFLDIFCTSCVVIHFLITFHMIIFVGEITKNVFALLTLFDLVYMLDIYFQAITAVRVHSVFISKPMDILVHKCKQFLFLLDVFASLPYDYFALLMEASPYYVGLCRLPKFIKLWKVIEMFNSSERLWNLSTRTLMILRSIIIHGLFILLGACFLYMWTCFDHTCRKTGWLTAFKVQKSGWSVIETSDFLISLIYTSSIYLQIKIHHVQPTNVIELLVQFVIGLCGFYLLNKTIVQMSGAIALENYPRFLYMYNLAFIDTIFHDRPEIRKYLPKVNEFISLQWFYSNAIQFHDIGTLMNHRSKFVARKVTHDYTTQILRKTQLFSCMSDRFLERIAGVLHLYVIPEGHTLQTPNTSAADLYIVLEGYCRVRSMAPEDFEKGNEFFYKQYDVFPVIGFFQSVSSFLFVETFTTVKVLSISYHDFMNCVKALPEDGEAVMTAISEHLKANENLIMRNVHLPLLHYPAPKTSEQLEEDERTAVDVFQYKGDKGCGIGAKTAEQRLRQRRGMSIGSDKTGGKDLQEYEQWKKVKTVGIKDKLFHLITRTYDPHGKYLYYEVFRSVVIIFELILQYLSLHRFVRLSHFYNTASIVLLVSHILDIYVRAHVQYFTPDGIRVTSRRSITSYYFSHSFTIDFISALPYKLLQFFEIFRGRDKNWINVVVVLIVQPLKLYRPFRLMTIVRKTIAIKHYNTIMGLSNTLVLMILFAHLAAFALVSTCGLDDDWYWQCPENSWLRHVEAFDYWNDNDLLYSRAYYELVISHVMRSSRYFTVHDFLLYFLLGIVVCAISVWYLASIVGYTAFSTKYLVNFQERRRRYFNFVSRVGIPKYLRQDLLKHYKYMFKKTRTDAPKDLLENFYPNLREAIQLSMYKACLSEVKIFLEVGMELYRFIVPLITEQYYIMHAQILQCNDINENIFFVKKGYVEVFVADHSVAVLGVGGMFGCFKASGASRSTIKVVAKVHADVLVVKTTKFLKAIRSYKRITMAMKLAHETNTEFFDTLEAPNKTSYTDDSINKYTKCTLWNFCWYTFDERNHFVAFYLYFTEMHLAPIMSIVCLISIMMISDDNMTTLYWVIVDVYFLLDMYMTCHIGVTDEESGLRITRVGELTRAYLRSWKFYLNVLTLIPLYLFKGYIHYKHEGILLLNKSLRILNMLLYYRNYLNTRYLPNHMRFTFLAYMLLFSLNAICFLLGTATVLQQDRSPSHREILSYYVLVTNIFNTAGIDTTDIDSFTIFVYMSCALFLLNLIFVLLTAGFCKLAVMIFYTDMEFRRSVITFKAYCQNEYVSKPIINQCWYYLMHLYSKHGGEQFPSLVLNAPKYIHEAHMAYMASDLITRHPMFKYAHMDFVRQLMRHLKYEFVMPGFTIVEVADKRNIMYFVAEGTVLSICVADGRTKYELLQRGASFGETQAIKGSLFTKTYKATTPVQLFGLHSKDWAYLLKWFPATSRYIADYLKYNP